MGRKKVDDVGIGMEESLRELTRAIVEPQTKNLVEDKLGTLVETASNMVEGTIPGHVQRAVNRSQAQMCGSKGGCT